MFKFLTKLKAEHKLFLFVCIVVLLIMLFWPRGFGFSAGLSGHLGGFRGSVEIEAFENFADAANKPSLVLFHADWCGHCKKMMPEWKKFKSQNKLNVLPIDVESENKEIMNKHGINGFPTIKFFPNGHANGGAQDYTGPRTTKGFHDFVKGVSQNLPNQAANVDGSAPGAPSNSAPVNVNSYVARNFDLQ